MFQKFLFTRSAGKIKYKYLFTLALFAIIIAGLFLASWANAEAEKPGFQEKLSFYLRKAGQKIMSVLQKPLNMLNNWLKNKSKEIKANFYQELEEMKISLLDLLKWSWKESTENIEVPELQ